MTKSNLDKSLFSSFNTDTQTATPIQTIIETKKDKQEDVDSVGFFARIPPSLKKRIKVFSVANDITQDRLITEILEDYFKKNDKGNFTL